MSILEKLRKSSTIKESDLLETSKFFKEFEPIPTAIPILNVALTGKFTGGVVPGLTIWAGASKNFKTCFSLAMANAYMTKYPDAVLLFYDSEFGAPKTYFKSFGIDMNRVLHTPVTDLEEFKVDLMRQVNQIEKNDHVIILVDSLGNLASRKEVDDTADGKAVGDMTRAKVMKSIFRMVTPHLTMREIPMVVINHTYKSMGLYPQDIVGGGTGVYYSASSIFIVGRQQEKVGTEIVGYNFIINVEKSRYIKEKSKIPMNVTFEHGINRFSGLLENALELGFVTKPSNGWYVKKGDVNKHRLKSVNTDAFWKDILADASFVNAVEEKYMLSEKNILTTDSIDDTIDEILNEEENTDV